VSLCNDREQIIADIEANRALIVALRAAIIVVATTGQNYQLDTGQTRQLVTRANLASMRDLLRHLQSENATLRAQLGCGKIYGRAAW
jgi:hypothetical protein